jgi:hypothetical protein
MAGGKHRNFSFFFSFFTQQFPRENESKIERKETGLRNLLVGLNVTQKLPLTAIVVATCALSLHSLQQQQHHTSSNNSRTSKVQEICCFQHEATGNRVFLELK